MYNLNEKSFDDLFSTYKKISTLSESEMRVIMTILGGIVSNVKESEKALEEKQEASNIEGSL